MSAPASDVEALPWREFLMTGTRTAKLATVKANGRPHVTPVGFVLDGNDIVFSTGKRSVKGRGILRSPEVALVVDEEVPPYPFVMVEGTAFVSEDLDEMLRWATKVGARYVGPDQADEMGRRNAVAGELLVRIVPTKIVARLNGRPRQTLNL